MNGSQTVWQSVQLPLVGQGELTVEVGVGCTRFSVCTTSHPGEYVLPDSDTTPAMPHHEVVSWSRGRGTPHSEDNPWWYSKGSGGRSSAPN